MNVRDWDCYYMSLIVFTKQANNYVQILVRVIQIVGQSLRALDFLGKKVTKKSLSWIQNKRSTFYWCDRTNDVLDFLKCFSIIERRVEFAIPS